MPSSDSIRLPEVMVFADPNGSGKSTITRMARTVGVYINADDIKATTMCSDLEAALKAEELRERCLLPVVTLHLKRFFLQTEILNCFAGRRPAAILSEGYMCLHQMLR